MDIQHNYTSFTHHSPELFSDKLTLTMKVNRSGQIDIRSMLKETGTRKSKSKFGTLGNQYKKHYEIKEGICQFPIRVLFSIEPTSKARGYLRLDFNPAHLQKEDIVKFRKALESVLGKYARRLYKHARITRLDIAGDIVYPAGDLMLHLEGTKRSRIYSNDAGEVESFYSGSPRSVWYINVYNKIAERASRGEKINADDILTRIEARFHPDKERVTLYDLFSKNSCYGKGRTFTLYRIPGDCHNFTTKFIQESARSGLSVALARMSKEERKEVLHILDTEYTFRTYSLDTWIQSQSLLKSLFCLKTKSRK